MVRCSPGRFKEVEEVKEKKRENRRN